MGTATDYSISSLSFRLDTLERRLREETDSRRAETSSLRELHYEGMKGLRELHYDGIKNVRELHYEGMKGLRELHYGGMADLRELHYDGMKDLRDEHYKLRSRASDLELRITTRTGIGLIIFEILVIMILASRS